MAEFFHPIVMKVVTFLRNHGIRVQAQKLDSDTFLPGLDFDQGAILVDEERLLYPGDLLHEAGHLAVTPSAERCAMNGTLLRDQGLMAGREIATIAWSYAAALHLGIELEVLFHPDGYKGSSRWLIETFSSGNYVGLPLLVWMGFCKQEPDPDQPDQAVFPQMSRWFLD